MTLNLPDDSATSEVIDPDGRSIGEIVRKDTGETVWSAFTNRYLDMTATDASVDLSGNSLQVNDGQTFLVAMQVDQLGASGQHYPGVFAEASGGGWNGYMTISSGDGSQYTSGTRDAFIRIEWAGGGLSYSNSVPIAVGDGTWHLFGFAIETDGSTTFFINDQTPSTSYNDYDADSHIPLTHLGPGYAGATNSGMGGKTMDSIMLFDSVLSPSTVADAYNNGTRPSSPLNYWDCQDDSDMTLYDQAGSADGSINNASYVEGSALGLDGSGDGGGGTEPEPDYYLDMTASGSHVDVSSHTIQISPGQSFLVRIRPTQIGSSGDPQYPGFFAESDTGGWNDFFSIRNDEGSSPATSGTANGNLTLEADDGTFGSADAISFDLDSPSWHLIGFTWHSDGSVTFWHNDGSISTRDAFGVTGTYLEFNRIGYGYAGATDDGSGGKAMDSPGIWDRELTSSEVSDWYNNGTVPDSPLHLWPFDDNSDTSTATDSAGSADGTINNASYVEHS